MNSRDKKNLNIFVTNSLIIQQFLHTLLQGLMWFSANQTGCRWLISYIDQKKFLACGPEFLVELSAPPEFSGSVTEKYLSTGWVQTFDLQIRKQIFYHCATVSLCLQCYCIHCVPSWDFQAVSVVTHSQIFRPYLVVTCGIFWPYLQLLAAEFSGRIR